MKSNLENVSNLEKKLKVEVPVQMVNDEFSRAYKHLQKQVNIKGFRKGKAPIDTIRTMYADKIKGDVVQNIVQTAYVTALKEHALIPVSMPQIDFEDIKEGAPFTFTANFEIRPDVTVKKKSGFKVEREKLTIDEAKIDATIDNIRQSNAAFESIKDNRPLANGDFAMIDFEGFINGEPLENGSAKGHQLEIGANQFIPGFEEGLVGMNKGESREVSIKFPDDYHVETLKGQPVTFKVTLHDIKTKAIPEMNEELLKKINQPSVEELRTSIRKEMEEGEKTRIETETRDALLKQFVEANPIEVPKSMLEEQRKSLVDDFQNRLKQQGFTDENFGEYQDKWSQDFDKTAEFMVKSALLIDKMADEDKLRATDEDVEVKLDEMAVKWGVDKAKIKQFYGQKDGINRLKYQITEDKVYQNLLSNSSVEEVTKKDKPKT